MIANNCEYIIMLYVGLIGITLGILMEVIIYLTVPVHPPVRRKR